MIIEIDPVGRPVVRLVAVLGSAGSRAWIHPDTGGIRAHTTQ